MRERVLEVVVCGAGPAPYVAALLDLAAAGGWSAAVLATPSGLALLDAAADAVAQRTGRPVRSAHRTPGDPRRSTHRPDAVIVAPATFNTVNKLAAGICDTYALDVLAERVGAGVPVVVLPFLNTALAARAPLRTAVAALRAEGVTVLLGPEGNPPHPPGTGADRIAAFPRHLALAAAAARTRR
ncbi:flavoprotein [Pilimelia anulata]|uniref:flavoprotein n=1 Tax=Pilimelia anulata TaxID=53371 RepID=UPI001E5A0970|nr:flavoprotein [Pilimelia anulata]